MTVNDFVSLDDSGVMFTVIDGDMAGCKSNPHVLIIADKGVVRRMYGDYKVASFEPKTKRNVMIWVKKGGQA